MTILVCHEAGHFFQARKYGVYASFPFFIPLPVQPIGTLGAVIAMDSRVSHRRALFDIGISGPLAGLVPTLVFCFVGLQPQFSKFAPPNPNEFAVDVPLLFKAIANSTLGPVPQNMAIQTQSHGHGRLGRIAGHGP